MRRAVYPGSFDPIHQGHLDVIARARQIFDEILVVVAVNQAKKCRFTQEERVAITAAALQDIPGCRVEPLPAEGLLADFCRQHSAQVIKGLRSGADFDYEVPMAWMNREIAEIETVFLPAHGEYAQLSSTMVKEVFSLGGDVSNFVPEATLAALRAGGDHE